MKSTTSPSRLLRSLVCLLAVLIASSPARAQTTTAALLGMVADDTGGALPGTTVTALNVGTGTKRTTVTDAEGRFLLVELLPGVYDVTVALPGFETVVEKDLALTVGQRAELRFALKVGAVTQEVTVVGGAPLVQTTESSMSGLVDERRLTTLPLSGRDFTQLALLQPGVVSARNARVNASKGFGTRISIAGSRPDQTGWLLDGMNIKSFSNFGTPGSASGLLLGVDAVQEFQVVSANFSAEFGGSSGGVINMITKSGTNDFHGSAYEFHRNDALDARNFFDRTKPDLSRHQFGASLGGPIFRNRTFFFANVEVFREKLGLTRVAVVPDANAHRGLIPTSSGALQQINIAASIRPILDSWPLPNGAPVGVNSGLAEYLSPVTDKTDQDYFMTRFDHRLSDRQSLFGRFTYDEGIRSTPAPLPIHNSDSVSGARYGTVQHTMIWTSRLLSTSRFGFSRNRLGQDVSLNQDLPAGVFFLSTRVPPNIVIPGLTAWGPSSSEVGATTQDTFEFQENVSYSMGRHSIQFGANVQRIHVNADGGPFDNGAFEWGSLRDFLEDRPFDAMTSIVPGSTSVRIYRQMLYGFYVRDDWTVKPNVTLNLGLRYEPYTVPTEVEGRTVTVNDWRTATGVEAGAPPWKQNSLDNFSPRLGVAWNIGGTGKTIVRSGFGLFYQPLLTSYYSSLSDKTPPFGGVIRNRPTGGNFATARQDLIRLSEGQLSPVFTRETSLSIVEANPNTSYEAKYHLTIERQLSENMAVTLGYLGGRGYHLLRNVEINGYPSVIVNGREVVPLPGIAPNPNFFRGQTKVTDGQSFYDALQVQVKRRFNAGFQFEGSYTWGKAIDDSTSGVGSTDFEVEGLSSTMYNTKADRGLSALHQEHNLTVNGLWALPSPTGSRLASWVLGGWQLGGIMSLGSGTPFSVIISGTNVNDNGRNAGGSKLRRPDWRGGDFDDAINPGNPDQYFDPSMFVNPPQQTYGNLPRNTFLGPGLVEVNLNVQKSIPLGFRDGGRLELKAEVFNLFNRANFALPIQFRQVVNGRTGALIPSAGKITNTVTTARQIQVGAKVVF